MPSGVKLRVLHLIVVKRQVGFEQLFHFDNSRGFNSGCWREVLHCTGSQTSVYGTNLQVNVHKLLLSERQHASCVGSRLIRDTGN